MVLAAVPPERNPERGYIRMFPQNENRNEGTFACSPGTKTRTSVHSPKPPFYETALLSPGDNGNLLPQGVSNVPWRKRALRPTQRIIQGYFKPFTCDPVCLVQTRFRASGPKSEERNKGKTLVLASPGK